MSITGINHITISVRDLDKSFAFYREVLGMKPLMKQAKGAYLRAGNLWFALELDARTRSTPLPEDSHIAFSIEQKDFIEVANRIRESGATIWKNNSSEGDSIYFLDPNGHKMEVHVGTWQSRIAHYQSIGREMQLFEHS